jgi:protein-S-isoprenylcysteine O-methyltransferase Ste14
MSMLDHRIPPPVVGALLAAAMWGVAALGPPLALGLPLRRAAIGLLIVAGLGFDLFGLLAFRASRTSINPLKPERASTLVTGGVYRLTRNPMYVGMALWLLAWGLHLSSWLAVAGPVIYVLYITQFQIRPEERVLQARFGQDYLNYTARVRRWL